MARLLNQMRKGNEEGVVLVLWATGGQLLTNCIQSLFSEHPFP